MPRGIANPNEVAKLRRYLEEKHKSKAAQEAELERIMARQRQINDAPTYAKMEFYCRCHGDWVCLAGKVTGGNIAEPIAYYVPLGGARAMELTGKQRMFKPCKARRWITDKAFDPYYRDSKMIQQQRRQATQEGWFLQPGDAGFKSKYGDPYKGQYAKLEAEEKAKWEAKNAK